MGTRASPAAVTREGPARIWWSQTGSNRRPLACHASALPAELWPHDGARTVERAPGDVNRTPNAVDACKRSQESVRAGPRRARRSRMHDSRARVHRPVASPMALASTRRDAVDDLVTKFLCAQKISYGLIDCTRRAGSALFSRSAAMSVKNSSLTSSPNGDRIRSCRSRITQDNSRRGATKSHVEYATSRIRRATSRTRRRSGRTTARIEGASPIADKGTPVVRRGRKTSGPRGDPEDSGAAGSSCRRVHPAAHSAPPLIPIAPTHPRGCVSLPVGFCRNARTSARRRPARGQAGTIPLARRLEFKTKCIYRASSHRDSRPPHSSHCSRSCSHPASPAQRIRRPSSRARHRPPSRSGRRTHFKPSASDANRRQAALQHHEQARLGDLRGRQSACCAARQRAAMSASIRTSRSA